MTIITTANINMNSPVGAIGAVALSAAAGIFGTTAILKSELDYESNAAILNGVAMSYALFRYYIGNMGDVKPAAVVAGIPLGTVQELSHGISDREVRYRANGGIFLAHQDGGHQSLRIVGKAYGTNRFWFLNVLDLLFLYGSTTKVDILTQQSKGLNYNEALPGHVPADNLPVWYEKENIPQPDGTVVTNKINLRVESNENAWRLFNLGQLDEGYHEKHMTFPVITRQRIYLSMYIETYSWRQSVDRTGQKQVEYTIFFRKYDPEPRYEFRTMTFPKTSGQSKTLIVYRETSQEKNRIVSTLKNASLPIMISFTLNMMEEPRAIALFSQKFMDEMKSDVEWTFTEVPSTIIEGGFF